MRQLRQLIVEKSQAAGRGWPPRAARRWSGWWRPGRGEGVRNPRCGRVGEEEEEKTKEPGTGDLSLVESRVAETGIRQRNPGLV